jgi:hypothetical protein
MWHGGRPNWVPAFPPRVEFTVPPCRSVVISPVITDAAFSLP